MIEFSSLPDFILLPGIDHEAGENATPIRMGAFGDRWRRHRFGQLSLQFAAASRPPPFSTSAGGADDRFEEETRKSFPLSAQSGHLRSD